MRGLHTLIKSLQKVPEEERAAELGEVILELCRNSQCRLIEVLGALKLVETFLLRDFFEGLEAERKEHSIRRYIE